MKNQTVSSFLTLLGHVAAGGVSELCIFEGKTPSHVGYFDDHSKAHAEIEQFDGKTNVFVSLNPCKRDLRARSNNHLKKLGFKDRERTKDTEILCDSWFLIDVDPRRPSGISSTDAELAAAVEVGKMVRDWLVNIGVPAQAIVTARSGNGCYVLVRLPNYPITEANKAIKQAFLNHVADLFDTAAVEIDRTVYNPARLCCAIGTRKMKGENIPERPHRLSSIGTIGGEKFTPAIQQTVTPFDLYALAENLLPKTEEPMRKGQQGKSGGFDLRNHTDKLHNEKTTARGYVYYDCPACGGVQRLHINETTGAYGCWHKCTAEAIRAALGIQSFARTEGNKAADEEAAKNSPLKIVCAADVMPEAVQWLWEPRIAKRKITVLEGEEGLGKSWLLCAIASGITHGKLPGVSAFEPGRVLMLSAEDGLGDTIRPRLDSVSAMVGQVFIVEERFVFDTVGLLRLEATISELQPVLVTIDPLFAYTGAKVDINQANQCRAITSALAAIAERQNCAIVILRHIGKAKGNGDPRAAGLGSIDIRAAARSVLLVGKDPDNDQVRAMVQTKNNLAPFAEPLGYEIKNAQFFWTGHSSLTAARILSAVGRAEDVQSQNDAEDFLRELLKYGAKPAKEIQNEAKEAGLTDYHLRSAKTRLRIKPFKRGGNFGGEKGWFWELPEDAEDLTECAEDAEENKNSHLQQNHSDKSSYGNGLAEDAKIPFSPHLQQPFSHLQEEREVFEL